MFYIPDYYTATMQITLKYGQQQTEGVTNIRPLVLLRQLSDAWT